MAKYDRIPAFERAGMSRVEAAAYIGVSPTLFDQLVVEGSMPSPIPFKGRRVWSRRELERHFDEAPRLGKSSGYEADAEFMIS